MSDACHVQCTGGYLYRVADRIGQGAFSNVYRGLHKSTGAVFALKVPRSNHQVQELERETLALTSLRHINIVRLFGIQNEVVSGRTVFVMEQCSRGSLLSLLEEPENHRGLHDADIIALLSHLASALTYLTSVGFVHRDIKPGNILVSETEVGRKIFKLSDFGSSKFVQETGEYESLTGTEEYLHPQLYERAFIDRTLGGKFTAAADLWSLGATLAHVVLGEVPFRPYEGTRKNRNEMYIMISRKPDQALFGRQNSPNGSIQYYTEFPRHCNISPGLRQYLGTIIRGLLRSNTSQWTLDTFSREADHVASLVPYTILQPGSLMLSTYYAEPYQRIDSILKLVSGVQDEKTEIKPCVFYDGRFLEDSVPISRAVTSLPVTSKERPLVVMSPLEVSTFCLDRLSPFDVLQPRSSSNRADDRKQVKGQVTTAWTFVSTAEQVLASIVCLRLTLQTLIDTIVNMGTLYESKLHGLSDVVSADSDRLSLCQKLPLDPAMADYVTSRRQCAFQRKTEIAKMKQEMSKALAKFRSGASSLQDTSCWNTHESRIRTLRDKAQGHFNIMDKIWKQVRDRKSGNISEGENLLRQAERLHWENLSKSLQSDWQSEFIPYTNEIVNHVKSWIRRYWTCHEHINTIAMKLTFIDNTRQKLTEDIIFVSTYTLKPTNKPPGSRDVRTSDILEEHRVNTDRLINLMSDIENLALIDGSSSDVTADDDASLFG